MPFVCVTFLFLLPAFHLICVVFFLNFFASFCLLSQCFAINKNLINLNIEIPYVLPFLLHQQQKRNDKKKVTKNNKHHIECHLCASLAFISKCEQSFECFSPVSVTSTNPIGNQDAMCRHLQFHMNENKYASINGIGCFRLHSQQPKLGTLQWRIASERRCGNNNT